MLRVVLAIALTSALLAVAAPALETGTVEVANDRIDSEIDGLEDEITVFSRNDRPPPGTEGARRTVTLELPAETATSPGLEYLVFSNIRDPAPSDAQPHPGPNGHAAPSPGTVVRWRVTGGTEQARFISGVHTQSATGTIGFETGGTHEGRLTHRTDGRIVLEGPEI